LGVVRLVGAGGVRLGVGRFPAPGPDDEDDEEDDDEALRLFAMAGG